MVAIAAKAARVPTGPRPFEARIKPKPPGQEERKAIVGAILDFPVLLDDSEVARVLELLQGESARIVATIAQCRRLGPRMEKVLDSSEFLAQMPPAIQAFAHARLAAPAHEDLQEARTTVMANAKKLREANIALETRVTVREQERDAGDWDAGVERAKHVDALVRERQGIRR
jgi:DNA primase